MLDTPSRDDLDPDAISRIGVTIGHPFGDIDLPLADWIARGPGPRWGVHPLAAWDLTTRASLPLSVIPFRYRNTTASRRWLTMTRQASPWAHLPPILPPAAPPAPWPQRVWRRLSAHRSPPPPHALAAPPTATLARGPVAACALSADGQTLVAAGWDDELRAWWSGAAAAPQILPGPPGGMTCCAVSADGRTVVAGGAAGAVWCWDAGTGARRSMRAGSTDWILTCAVSADGQVVAAAGDAGVIWLWDGATGTLRHALHGHAASVLDCGLSADGQVVGSVSADGTARIWDGQTGQVQHVVTDPLWSDTLTSCVVFPAGDALVVTAAGISVLIDCPTGTVQGIASDLHAISSSSADGQTVLTVAASGAVALRDGRLEERTDWIIPDRLTGGAVAGAGRGLLLSGEGGLYWYADAPAPPVPAPHTGIPSAAASKDQ